ncbi:hypothetical protein UFOVP353_42 [uncultured Caudovirales phage]|uniref:Uncharacterized protein n=1 Tax=uncultured Caudovirales phage TaxID=2100421 RepID=A0A6J5LZ27_9CAUD|nr:hypothetical protein UFOVP353_42 [uncultured Caudovirales phage]
MTHDFKSADNYLLHNKKPNANFSEDDAYIFVNAYYHTIRRALLIADALMGEPSASDIKSAVNVTLTKDMKDLSQVEAYALGVFKNLRARMLEEIK